MIRWRLDHNCQIAAGMGLSLSPDNQLKFPDHKLQSHWPRSTSVVNNYMTHRRKGWSFIDCQFTIVRTKLTWHSRKNKSMDGKLNWVASFLYEQIQHERLMNIIPIPTQKLIQMSRKRIREYRFHTLHNFEWYYGLKQMKG